MSDTLIALLSSPEVWLSLLTLSLLEIVLGIDNIIFIAILASRLPTAEQREQARKLGLAGAFISRLGLLAAISWIVKLDQPLFQVAGKGFSGKALLLFFGGVFLLYKATKEIHHKLEAAEDNTGEATKAAATYASVIAQIMLLDVVFSIDSVITAVGMTEYVSVMVAANLIALFVMLVLGKAISQFVERHPSVKVLALSFLLMIGMVLIAEGFDVHIPKGYIYGAMAFSVFVELLNIRTTRRTKPVTLNGVPRVSDAP